MKTKNHNHLLVLAHLRRAVCRVILVLVALTFYAGSMFAQWPDATNTGVPPGTVLTPSGSIVVTTPGAVISGLDINGTVDINANNVTLKNCKVLATSFYVVKIQSGITGATVQDCEINGVGNGNDGDNGIAGQGTFLRNNIYNVENGITLQGDNSLIQDNYVHNLLASGSPHYDGIQIDGGISNATIRHNTIIDPFDQTSAVMIDNYFGPINNITVDNNRLIGGGYTVYSDGQFSGGSISGVSFTNNRMGKGYWGYASIVNNTPVWCGNVDDVTGSVISISGTQPCATDTTPPSTPANLVATAISTSQINLTWNASTDNVGVTGYKVERCQGASCSNFTQIATPGANSYSNTGLTAGTTYTYRVRATDAAGNLSGYSGNASATTQVPPPPDSIPPSVPAGLNASAVSSSQINLSWTASTDNVGVTGYKVERCQGASCSNFTQIATPGANSYSNTGLTAGTAYTYRVRATDAAGNLSGYSGNASATTLAGSTCFTSSASWQAQAFASQSGTFQVTFNATPLANLIDGVTGLSTSPATDYTDLAAIVRFNTTGDIDARNGSVYQAVSSIPYTANTTYQFRLKVNIPAHTYSAYVTPQGGSELTIGINYAFRTEQSTASSLAYWNLPPISGTHQVCNFTVSSDTTPPSTPANLVATAISTSQINLTWNASTDNVGVTGYKVERCQGASCSNFTQIATPGANSYSNTGLTAGTAYTYRVRATDAAGNLSGYSGNASATTQAGSSSPTFINEYEVAWNTSTSPKTTASFAVQTSDVLVAYGMTEDATITETISGGSLTWTQRQLVNISQYTWLSIWTATVDANKTMSVTFTRGGGTGNFGGDVLIFRNSSGVGASSKANAASGAPTFNLTTTQANSAIVVANADWTALNGSSRSWSTNAGALTEKSYALSSGAYTIYGGYHANAGSIGTYLVGLSAPGAQKYSIAAIEIKGTTGPLAPSSPALAMSSMSTVDIRNLTNKSVAIYPNPAQSVLNISMTKFPIQSVVRVFDINGKQLIIKPVTQKDVQLDVRKLIQGIYFIKVEDPSGEIFYSSKFFKR